MALLLRHFLQFLIFSALLLSFIHLSSSPFTMLEFHHRPSASLSSVVAASSQLTLRLLLFYPPFAWLAILDVSRARHILYAEDDCEVKLNFLVFLLSPCAPKDPQRFLLLLILLALQRMLSMHLY